MTSIEIQSVILIQRYWRMKTYSDCPVCYEQKLLVKSYLCTHLFCRDCILIWNTIHSNCPLCRRDTPEHQPLNQQDLNHQPLNYQVLNQQTLNQQPLNQQTLNQQDLNHQNNLINIIHNHLITNHSIMNDTNVTHIITNHVNHYINTHVNQQDIITHILNDNHFHNDIALYNITNNIHNVNNDNIHNYIVNNIHNYLMNNNYIIDDNNVIHIIRNYVNHYYHPNVNINELITNILNDHHLYNNITEFVA